MKTSIRKRVFIVVALAATCSYPADNHHRDLNEVKRAYSAVDAAFVQWDRDRRIEIARAKPEDPNPAELVEHERKVRAGVTALDKLSREIASALKVVEKFSRGAVTKIDADVATERVRRAYIEASAVLDPLGLAVPKLPPPLSADGDGGSS